MKTQKLSFNAISGVLSRSEMKKIMAGSGGSGTCSGSCDYKDTKTGHTTTGTCRVCEVDWCKGDCYCSNGIGSCS